VRERQRRLVASDYWIMDGNYSSTLGVRLDRADTVIVLALPRWRCVIRVLRRWLQHQGRPVQAAGCSERISPAFLRWVWNYPSSGRVGLDTALAKHGQGLRVIELGSPADVRKFLARNVKP
jgi:adenylate kinase family enzyme